MLWSVFFLVPTGRGSSIDLISAEEFEHVFEKLYQTEDRKPGSGKKLLPFLGMSTPDGIGRAPKGINDGKGFVFVSHRREVFPSGFLPISGGNIKKQSLGDRSIAIRRFSKISATPANWKANAGAVNSAKLVADRARELMR